MAVKRPARFDVYLVTLDPTVGSEIRKTRPAVVVSPDAMNRHLNTVIVAPMTTGGKAYPTRVPCTFRSRQGHVALDQLRTIDHARLAEHLGALDEATSARALAVLADMFAP